MRLYKPVFILFFSLLALNVSAQSKKDDKEAKSNINNFDSKGKRQGMWMFSREASMGESAYSEFGNYLHGLKTGLWYKVDELGDLIAVERYKNNVLDGEVKYYTNGRLIIKGNYKALNPNVEVDTFIVTDPVTELQKIVTVSTTRGTVKNGMWYYYDAESGRIIKEEEYQIDNLIYKKVFPYSKSDSSHYNQRVLPHTKGKEKYFRPPVEKQNRYTN